MMAEDTGEMDHLAARGEYEAGIAALDTLVDGNGRFVDHEALVVVRETLASYLDVVQDGYPLKKRRLE